MTAPVVIGTEFAPAGNLQPRWVVVDLKTDAAGTLHAVLHNEANNDHRTLAVHVLRDRNRFQPVGGEDSKA